MAAVVTCWVLARNYTLRDITESIENDNAEAVAITLKNLKFCCYNVFESKYYVRTMAGRQPLQRAHGVPLGGSKSWVLPMGPNFDFVNLIKISICSRNFALTIRFHALRAPSLIWIFI